MNRMQHRQILPVGDPSRPTKLEKDQRWIGTAGSEYQVTAVNGDTATLRAVDTGSEYAAPCAVVLGRYRFVDEPSTRGTT